MLGWELALWRLVGTLVLSLSAGLLTHFLMQQGWLGTDILRQKRPLPVRSRRQLVQDGWQWLRQQMALAFNTTTAVPATLSLASIPVTAVAAPTQSGSCGGESGGSSCSLERPSFRQRLIQETWAATRLVVQFMALAFLLEALILLFVPEAWIVGLLGSQNRWAVPLAALAFLIAGPTTTLPAMAAVWGLVRRRVFVLYVSFALVGAVVLGMVYALTAG
jgi:hypothetical protein